MAAFHTRSAATHDDEVFAVFADVSGAEMTQFTKKGKEDPCPALQQTSP